jgi:hypothetical protein
MAAGWARWLRCVANAAGARKRQRQRQRQRHRAGQHQTNSGSESKSKLKGSVFNSLGKELRQPISCSAEVFQPVHYAQLANTAAISNRLCLLPED